VQLNDNYNREDDDGDDNETLAILVQSLLNARDIY
jgi:hypothetical protein